MASSTVPTDQPTGFGRVSRTVGTAFRYLLLTATLVGIVALGVLLVFVTNDAIRPLSAEPAWLATMGLTAILAPISVAGWLWRYKPSELSTGLSALGLLVVGAIFGGGAVIIFTDVIPPTVWLAYVVAALPVGAAIVLSARHDRRLPFLARLIGVGAVAMVSFWQLPGLVSSLGILPADWLILLATVALPVAGLVGTWVAGRLERRRAGAIAAIASTGFAGILGYAGMATGTGGPQLIVFAAVGILPILAFIGLAVAERGRDVVGMALPVVAVGGLTVGLWAEQALGFRGPNSWLTWDFLTSTAATPASKAGIYPGIVGTILLMIAVAVLSFPVGVGAAIYLEEYAPDTRFTRIVDVNISNLAGVPSVVYGLLGLGAFVRFGGLAPGTVIVGGLTLSLLILPIVIISAREAIRAVPESRRKAAYGMGATRWQAVRSVVLPEAVPGILTGTILALGRAIGETAPLLVIGAPAIFGVPDALGDRVGAIPLQIYAWASTFASEAFYTTVLAAGVVTILVVLLTMNSIAIVLRNRYQRDT